MIQYNPKAWFSLIFKFHKSDTFRILMPAMLCLGVYGLAVAYILLDLLGLTFKSSTILHSLLGFVISLLLVFRTNTAYDRWWEARKLWGALVNNSRNFAIKAKSIFPESEHEYIKTLLANFCIALKHHLRSEGSLEKLIENETFKVNTIANKQHVPNELANLLFAKTNQLYKSQHVSGDQLIILNNELTALTDITGACERIKNTPIPYSYSLFIKKFIFVYTLTIPFGLLGDFGYWVAPINMFIFYALTSLEVIAEEIEDPFGNESNDLPTDQIAKNIEKSITEIFEK
jgi:ion channel-forming bestrophin family protein